MMKLVEGLLTVSQYEKGTEDKFLEKLEYSGYLRVQFLMTKQESLDQGPKQKNRKSIGGSFNRGTFHGITCPNSNSKCV